MLGVPAPRHLTQLHAVDSELCFTEGAGQTVGIQDLFLLDTVSGIHKEGLCGCTTLQAVDIAESSVKAIAALAPYDLDEDMDLGVGYQLAVPCIPATLSRLSQLTVLKLAVASESIDGHDMAWVYHLQTLMQLTLEIDDTFT